MIHLKKRLGGINLFKSNMLKWFRLGAVVTMVLGIFFATFTAVNAAEAVTYGGEAKGHNGSLSVEVSVLDGQITEVKVLEHSESAGIADPAIEGIPAAIIEKQSLAVDVIAGASVTSQAILSATEAALAESDLDVEALLVADASASEESATGEVLELQTQVLVAGGGIAGLAAALEAADNGAEVILIEKMPALGGSTIRSGGEILAAETHLQEENGMEASIEDFAAYLIEVGEGNVDEEFIHHIAENSAENIQWLVDNGVVFMAEPQHTHSTIPDNRRHIVEDGGAGLISALEAQLAERGVEILKNTPAVSLIEEEGVVIGVKATNEKSDDITILADAVILATGGYSRNEEMLATYHPSLVEYTTNTGDGNTGDGILMGETVGAELIMHDSGINLATNPNTYFGYGEEAKGLFVTPTGERFMDESRFHFQRSREMHELGINTVWYVFDEAVYDERVQKSIDDGMAVEADSLEELAEKMEVDPAVITETIEVYNEMANVGEDTLYNKPAEFMQAIESGKFYAAKMVTSNSGTHGGLKINLDGQVINTDGEAIEGLYAAGEVASGQILHIGYPGSGTAIISFLTIGRNAGRAAADYVSE